MTRIEFWATLPNPRLADHAKGQTISGPLLTSVAIPAALGAVMGWIDLTRWRNARLSRPAWLVALLAIYWLLEGLPPFPPIAAKQKLFYLIVLLAVPAALAPRLGAVGWALLSTALMSAAFVWLGINKFAGGPALVTFLPVAGVALLLISGASFIPQDGSRHAGFAAPLAILAMALAGAALALVGAFIGLAQLLGATAALIGGYLAPRYLLLLSGGSPPAIAMTPDTHWFVLAVVVVMLLLTSLLAPNVSLAAMALLAFTPAVAAATPPLRSVAYPIVPLLSGILAAIPAAAAVLVALWQRGSHAAN